MTFNELYQNYSGEILHYALSFTKNLDDAKDIRQDTFIKAFRKMHTLQDTTKIRYWLHRICRNTAINFVRKQVKYQVIELDDDLANFQVGLPDHDTFELARIQTVISELPNGYRTIFNLRMDGYKHREIAEMLDIKPVTSKTQYQRARNILMKKI